MANLGRLWKNAREQQHSGRNQKHFLEILTCKEKHVLRPGREQEDSIVGMQIGNAKTGRP